ncbi:phage shock protein C [Enterovibrio norvegicus]|uniref:Envelope stress response membrane protein PspC n=2 Tax=Enterovibrio norvegicus TaxID=188144 RepID=A0A2N7L9I9_9GAMM|nr:envelope stress response membrane protein PspC [Enterovibrio norvegicus]MCC4796554.1 envelope stress response membrane protein PspC [Enterovibrio norvegicus]OEF52401.1 phage shock protein C [Enterovibrio norvegicus]OEF55375.1 phage shock protein C [Enterovibrio norvegicus]PMH64262.1 phage shock protein C [Enterovibrio norvegicus]PMI26212.1 phage shock protein C [Enterovibrio norvegicus]
MSKTLYRDPVNGKIGGVCAGVADYFGVEIWLVRILTVTAFLIGMGFFVLVAYLAAMLILEKMPPEEVQQTQHMRDHQVKQKPWQQGKTANDLLVDIDSEMKEMEQDVAKMEAYVTSSEFDLNRKFKQL